MGSFFNNLPLACPTVAVVVDISLNGQWWDILPKCKFQNIWTRSKEYARLAVQQGLPIVSYIPDISFGLPSCPTPIQSGKSKLGVVLNSDLSALAMIKIVEALQSLSSQFEIHIISMHHGKKNSDVVFNNLAVQQLKVLGVYSTHLDNTYDPQIVSSYIAKMDAVISMRFHGILLAAMNAKPFLAISNPGKNSLFCEQENIEKCFLNIKDLDTSSILKRFQLVIEEPDLPKTLRNLTTTNSELVLKLFQELRRWVSA
jgi:hypothetical protein